MMKMMLSKSAAVTLGHVPKVTAALLLSFSAGCTGKAWRESGGAASAAASVESAAAAVRRVQVSAEGAEPSVSAATDGSVYVAWVAHRPGAEADVYVARYGREGAPAGLPVRVNHAAGEVAAWRGDPPDVAVAPDGTVYVAWTGRAGGAGHATTLYLSASHDGGKSFAPPVRVNDDTKACVHGMHSLAVGRDGRVYLAWLDERNLPPPEPDEPGAAKPGGMHGEQNREVYFAASSDGGRTFARNRRVASEACPCCKTALAVGPEGRVYVGWRQVLPGDFRHIAVASTVDGGETFDAPVVVSDDRWELRGCPVSGPALAAGDVGSLRVLWYTAGGAGEPGLYMAESSDGGRTFAPRRAVSAGGVRGTPSLLADERSAPTAVFEGAGGSGSGGLRRLRVGGEPGGAGAEVLGAGSGVSASARDGRLSVAYVAQGGVWLASFDGEK
jgi:hypothetical protein